MSVPLVASGWPVSMEVPRTMTRAYMYALLMSLENLIGPSQGEECCVEPKHDDCGLVENTCGFT